MKFPSYFNHRCTQLVEFVGSIINTNSSKLQGKVNLYLTRRPTNNGIQSLLGKKKIALQAAKWELNILQGKDLIV